MDLSTPKNSYAAEAIDSVNGYPVRPVSTEYGRAYKVGELPRNFPTRHGAERYAESLPPAPRGY